jgi:hypothetical protein
LWLSDPPDTTLTVENVTGVMEKVTVNKRRLLWSRVLEQKEQTRKIFHLGAYIVDEIYISHSSGKEKTHACSDVYVNCHPESSWEHLTSVLYKENEMTVVDQARPFLPPRGNILIIVSSLHIIATLNTFEDHNIT